MIDNQFGLDKYEMPVIAVDFDGTIAGSGDFPQIGYEIKGAKETINRWFDEGYWIIINSCRSGKLEADMRSWLDNRGFKYHAINDNLDWRIEKFHSDPRKIGADIYIDNHCIDRCQWSITYTQWMEWNEIVKQYTKRRVVKISVHEAMTKN